MILVTGAAGLVGWAVAHRLVAAGHDVIATDFRRPDRPLPCSFAIADLRDPGAVASLLKQSGARRVVHAGAISGSMVAPNDPFLVVSVNVTGTIHLAEACRLAGIEKLVALSSIGVYGDQADFAPVLEDAPKNATNIYSCSKIAMESVLYGYRENFGLPVTALRVSSIFGLGRRTACFIRSLLEAARAGRAAVISGDTVYRRQFCYIDDAAEAVCLALFAADAPSFVYNITGATWLTELEVARVVQSVVATLRVEIGDVEPLGLDGRTGPLSIQAACGDLGYTPHYSLAAGVRDYAGLYFGEQGLALHAAP